MKNNNSSLIIKTLRLRASAFSLSFNGHLVFTNTLKIVIVFCHDFSLF